MAEKKGSSIRFDDFVGAVHADPAAAEPSFLLSGYIGRSDNEANLRIYPDASLGHWFEVPQEDVIHSMPQSDSPLGGSHVWVRASANITPGAPKVATPAGGEEGDGDGVNPVPDTGIFNPLQTIHPTLWTQIGCHTAVQNCGPVTIHPTIWTQIGCNSQAGCIETVACLPHGGAEIAQAQAHISLPGCIHTGTGCAPITARTLATLCTHPGHCPPHTQSFVCPPITARTLATLCTHPGHCPPHTQSFVCPQNTAATVCTQLGCPQTITCPTRFGCPTQLGCPVTVTCPTRFGCPTQLGCPNTISCPPHGGGGGLLAQAQMANPSIETVCTQAPPCVGHTGWQACGQEQQVGNIGHTGWQGCHLMSAPPNCPTVQQCPHPLSAPPNCPTVQQCHQVGITGWQGCGQEQQGGNIGHTGWQGCHLLSAPPNCPTVQQCPPPLSAPPHCPTVQECLGAVHPVSVPPHCPTVAPMCPPLLSQPGRCPTVGIACFPTVSGPCLPYTMGGCVREEAPPTHSGCSPFQTAAPWHC